MRVNDYFDRFYLSIIKFYRVYCEKKSYRRYVKLFKKHNIPIRRLSSEQKNEIDKIYSGYGKYNYNTHILCYSLTGKFDPYIMPERLFRTTIEPALNKQTFKDAWSDKSYFDLFLNSCVKFPDTIYRNISGNLLDNDYNPVSKADVISLLESKDRFVIKPSIDNGEGKGVTLVKRGDDIKKILPDFGSDYIIQEVFEQHPTIARFNPSSVNTIKYESLYYNDEVIPLMAMLRCGAEGAFTDNTDSDGEGRFLIGIDENGRLEDVGYHTCGLPIKECPNGEKFAGVEIPGFDKMTQAIKESHKRLALFGFVGWDFAIGSDGEPCCIEYNIKGPGVFYEQCVSGPLFGKYTKDVLEYCKNKNK